MAIVLVHGLDPAEIRVLQEYRRLNVQTLPLTTLTAIRHPAGGGDTPARGLAAKGFLEADAAGEGFTLTEKAREFLAIEAKPEFEEAPKKAAAGPAGEATATE